MGTFGGLLAGLAIGFVGGMIVHKYKKPRQQQQTISQAEKDDCTIGTKCSSQKSDTQAEQFVPAETAFADNKKLFIPLLSGVNSNGISNREKWTETIVGLNNKELIEMWKAAARDHYLWITYLQTFGYQADLVDEFDATEHHKEMYQTDSGETITTGQHYQVVKPGWIFTDEDNNKEVAKIGIVKKI